MNRNSGNVSSTKKLFSGAGNNSKPNRKSFKRLSESSTVSSDRNSSAQSEDDVRIPDIHVQPPVMCEPPIEEQELLVKKLKAQVKDLKHKLRVLEESVESKDYSLGTIAKEKDRATGEIRRLERSNKQLRQQLNDERTHYLEEKEKFCAEMTRFKKKLQEAKSPGEVKKTPTVTRQPLINQSLRWQLNNEKGDFADVKPPSSATKMTKSQEKTPLGSFTHSESNIQRTGSLKSFHLYEGDDASLQMAALRTENAKLRSIICERDERNYELCLRFLRMKHYKNDIKSRFQDLENEYLQVIANLMDKIDEARQEFNFIIDQKFKRPLHSTNAMYLQLVQKNSRMAFENASLRLENQCLKKELNKYANGVSDSARTPNQKSAGNNNVRVPIRDSNADGKFKTKKNVNFKEIRTIYDRGYAFKNSDTDSNYMSKTSTTVPSYGSLPDAKSTESVVECDHDGREKASTSFQANSIPDDILKKIFKRIDTPSCQTSDSGRSKRDTSSNVTIKHDSETIKEKSSIDPVVIRAKSSQSSDRRKQKGVEVIKVQNEPTVIEHKCPRKVTDSSSMCDSKESFELKENTELKSNSPTESILGMDAVKVHHHEGNREKLSMSRTKARVEGYRDHNVGDGVETFKKERRNRSGKQERLHRSNQEREQKRSHRMRQQEFKDSCALQEKLKISDKELPLRITGQTESGMTADFGKGFGEKAENAMTRIETVRLRELEDDEGMETARGLRYLSPAVGSRSKSSNKVNLEDELLDALRSKRECGDPAVDTRFIKEVKSRISTSSTAIKGNTTAVAGGSEVTHSRRTEGSKRFSHRLISTSPETLRNILTESQLGGSYHMGPFTVGHATMEMSSAFKTEDDNSNEIFLQLVIPKSTAEQSSQVCINQEKTREKITVEKETSMSGLHPVKSKTRAETTTSGVRIPVSHLTTSNSTIELDSAPTNDRNDLMLRTLSAPGLLESGWLDQYICCEMKDNSTNT